MWGRGCREVLGITTGTNVNTIRHSSHCQHSILDFYFRSHIKKIQCFFEIYKNANKR